MTIDRAELERALFALGDHVRYVAFGVGHDIHTAQRGTPEGASDASWADGGRTKLDNLVLLCRHHRRLMHEGGYTLTAATDGRLTFRRPDGRRILACPRPRRAGPASLRQARRPDACVPLSSGDPLNLVYGVDAMLDFAPIASGEPPGV